MGHSLLLVCNLSVALIISPNDETTNDPTINDKESYCQLVIHVGKKQIRFHIL